MRRRWALLTLGALALAHTAHAQVADPSTAPAAAADAYGLYVDAMLSSLAIPVGQTPLARATQEAPPNADAPAQGQVLATGPVPPETGQLVRNIGVLTSTAEADDTPMAKATSQAATVGLIDQGGVPLLSVGLVRAESTTTCTDDPSGSTQFTDIQVGGVAAPTQNPGPNFELAAPVFNPLGIKVVLNEQHLTADGRGMVVNGIHIYQLPGDVPALFTGDIVVAHAMSTVNCPNGAGTTGGQNPVNIVKEVDTPTATAGDELTYTATVQNRSEDDCAVNRFIDHLPAPFEFVSTSGDFGDVATTVARPGGGSDVIIEPTGMVIDGGAEANQTFVVKVTDDAELGVYFNNVEIFCGNLGNWVKGLDAPVEVVGETVATTTTTTEAPIERGAELASTGGWGFGAGAATAGFAALLFALRRRLA